jgi:hypothetical protein
MKSDRHITIIEGDLLDQDVEVTVNAWNRNVIPSRGHAKTQLVPSR